jgi:hypothetical protein
MCQRARVTARCIDAVGRSERAIAVAGVDERSESGQHQVDVAPVRPRAHQADPPGVALHRTEPASNLDPEALQQASPDFEVVGSIRDRHGSQGVQTIRSCNPQLEAHGFETSPERIRVEGVPRETSRETLEQHLTQSLVQSEELIDRCRVVVSARRSPVPLDQVEVQVPALAGSPALGDASERSIGEVDGRQTRRARQALLGPGVQRVDSVRLDIHWMSGQGRDGVHQQQCPELVCELAQARQGLEHTGRGLCVDDAYETERAAPGGFTEAFDIERLPEDPLDQRDVGARASRDLGHTTAENTGLPDQDLVARLHEVDDTGLHTCGARGGDRGRASALGAQDLSKHGP